MPSYCLLADLFQSTLPMKGATGGRSALFLLRRVSIHAPNEGSDVDGNGTIGV